MTQSSYRYIRFVAFLLEMSLFAVAVAVIIAAVAVAVVAVVNVSSLIVCGTIHRCAHIRMLFWSSDTHTHTHVRCVCVFCTCIHDWHPHLCMETRALACDCVCFYSIITFTYTLFDWDVYCHRIVLFLVSYPCVLNATDIIRMWACM